MKINYTNNNQPFFKIRQKNAKKTITQKKHPDAYMCYSTTDHIPNGLLVIYIPH